MRPLSRGYTIVELIVVSGIFLLLTGGLLANYTSFNETQKLRQASSTLKTTLRLAQTKAVAGEKPTSACATLVGHQVTFTASTYSLQPVCSAGPVGVISTSSLPTGVAFFPIPTAMTYEALQGTTTLSGTTPITLVGSSKSYVLEIAPSGDITDLGLR